MANALLGWITGKEQNRRKYPRKRKPYVASYSTDGGTTTKPAIGVDISGGGLCIVTQEAVDVDEFDILATLEKKQVVVRAKAVWKDQVSLKGKPAWRFGMKLTGIKADDWDAVMRFTTDAGPVVETNKAFEELEKARMTPDDTARLIPEALQNRLLKMLVARRRLAPIEQKTPLVAYFYSGLVRHNDKLMHKLTIQSKVVNEDSGSSENYETRFMFDETGRQVVILN